MREDIPLKTRIVIKIGTSSLTLENGEMRSDQFSQLSSIISLLLQKKKEVVLVTSGAVHVGTQKLLATKGSVQSKQAAAAIGQVVLMKTYEQAFATHQIAVAQVLITRDILLDKDRKVNAKNALVTLLNAGIIPIINENDVMSNEDIGYGDNDRLSADVAVLVEAELLLLLSDIDGLYSCDPKKNPQAIIIPCVHEITQEINNLAQGSSSKFAKGGMITKIMAAKICSDSGIETIIANSINLQNIQMIMDGQEVGTLFLAHRIRSKSFMNNQFLEELNVKGSKAKEVSFFLSGLPTDVKNQALKIAGQYILESEIEILDANQKDIDEAKQNGAKEALLDQLMLNTKRIQAMVKGLEQVAVQEDPIGEMVNMKKRPNGLALGQKRVPLGVVGMIYEARPNVTVDAFGLCLKTGNSALLRGGKEALKTNIVLVKILQKALINCNIPPEAIQLIENTSRESTFQLMHLNGLIDVIIPRGSGELIRMVVQHSTVPVIETGAGNCHVYVDKFADENMAIEITFNAKTQRISTSNTIDSMLIHKDIAAQMLPPICKKLREKNVEIRGDEKVLQIIPDAVPATEQDWQTEFLDYIIAVKVVDSIEEAIAHINKHGTRNSEAIITENYSNSQKFLNEVDAAAVYVNASTRLTDGFEFGFGAEIGISTQKIHARGPMGLKELTSTKYIIYGTGQIRKLSQNL